MRKIKFGLILTVLFLLSACSGNQTVIEPVDPEDENFNATGMPIVDERITIEFMTGKSPINEYDYNEVLLWQTYEDMTNIHIDWGLVPLSGLSAKRSLLLAVGDYPEAFYNAGLPDFDIFSYGQQGIFLELTDLIDAYMPNLKALLEAYPEVKKGLTFPDGGIYSLPTIYDPQFTSITSNIKPYIRQDWLDALNMDVPETTDEFYEYLKAVKETDLFDQDEDEAIPFGATSMDLLYEYLKGSFGVGNKGKHHDMIDLDPETGTLRFFPMTEGYRELLTYMNKLYEEGLIDDEIYTIDELDYQSRGASGLYGSTMTTNPETRFGLKDVYVGLPALEGPDGHKSWNFINSPLANKGSFVITNKNQNIAATLRWLDYFYSDEGAEMFFMGIEGVTFERDAEGQPHFVDDLVYPDTGLPDLDKLKSYLTYIGGGYPGMIKQSYYKGSEILPSSIEAVKKLEPNMIDDVWPPFTYTLEEMQDLVQLEIDLEKYVTEMRAQFIVGQADLSDWDAYVEEFAEIGLDEFMEIQENAYERYRNQN